MNLDKTTELSDLHKIGQDDGERRAKRFDSLGNLSDLQD